MRPGQAPRRGRVGLLGALSLAFLIAAAPATSDSPVADAAERGELETVRALLKAGEDANAAQGDGMTALHWSARHGNVEMAQILVYAGANVHATTRLGGHTPLLMASGTGQASMIATLLDAGADANGRTTTGTSSLHFAAASGNVDAIAVLLDHGADPNARETAAGQTPLMFAAAYNRPEAIGVLVGRGADPGTTTNVVDVPELSREDGVLRNQRRDRVALDRAPVAPTGRGQQAAATRTAAQTPGRATVADSSAAELQGREAATRRPATPHADSTAADTPPRARQAQVSDSSAAELQGRDQQASTGGQARGRGRQAATPAEEEEDDPARSLSYTDLVGGIGGMTALLHAAREGHVEAVIALLDAGADIDQVSGGDHTSPLLIAAINGRFDIAMLLLERGADPNIASHAGATPLYGAINVHWAPHAFYPQPSTKQENATHLDLIRALLEAGADPDARLGMKVWYTGYNFDQSGVNEVGATAFWRAAQSSDVEAMRLLAEHGADPNIWTTVAGGGRGSRNNAAADYPIPPVPPGGPAVSPLHAATGTGYDGNYHRNAPYGWLPAVKYLVEELGADVNMPDYNGSTPLHNAAFRGDNEMILYLVEKGADVMAVNRSGQTTVDLANGPIQRLQPFFETIKLLESLNAINNHKCVSC